MLCLDKLWQLAIDASIPLIQLRSVDGVTVQYELSGSATQQDYDDMNALIAVPDNLVNLFMEEYNLTKEQIISKALNRIAFLEGPGVGDTAWSAMSAADQDQMMEWMRQESVFFYKSLLAEIGHHD